MTRLPGWPPPGVDISAPGAARTRAAVLRNAHAVPVIKEIRGPDPVRSGVSAISAGFDIVEPGSAVRGEWRTADTGGAAAVNPSAGIGRKI